MLSGSQARFWRVNYDLVIFDLDGTLVDSLPDIASALNRGLVGLGRAPVTLGEVRGLVGEGVLRLAEKALAVRPLPAGPPDPPALARDTGLRGESLLPGPSLRAIAALSRDRRAAARSSRRASAPPGRAHQQAGRTSTRPLLAALGIAQLFDAVIGDDDGYPRKPDPAAAQTLLRQVLLRIPPARWSWATASRISSSPRAVGCASAAALWGYGARADLAAQSPTYLLEAPGPPHHRVAPRRLPDRSRCPFRVPRSRRRTLSDG